MGWWGDNVPEETLSRDEASRVVRRLFRMLRPQRARIVVATFVLMAQALALLAGPLLVRHGIDAGLPSVKHGGDAGALDLAVVIYLVLALAGLALGRFAIVLVARIGEGFLKVLRNRLFGHMMSLSLDYFETEKTGKIVARMTSDIDAMQELVSQGLVLFVQNVFVFVGAVVIVLVISWQLAVGILVIVPPVYFGSRWFRRVSNKAYLEVRDRISTNLSTLQEGLEGVRVVQAFGREDAFTRKFNRTNEDQYHANMHTARISAKYFPVIEYAGVAGTAVIIGYGGWLTTRGIVTVGTVAAFVLWLNNLFEPINQLSQLYNTVQSSAAALAKIFGVLDTRPTVRQRQGAIDLPRSGAVDVEHVTFAYGPNEPVLHDVSLRISDGERLALVGPTGAGKSTLAKLIARFYDPAEGSVRVGGVDLRDAEFVSLRRRIIVVPQEGFLFAGTLRDNVRVGRPEATDADVEQALRVLGLLERFAAFPEGLETEVRERGSRLSAGERQLVSLARAALADPSVLILDEATSNLDPGTERDVERALEQLMHGRTVVVVAHRLSTAARADRIGVVFDGRLAELGTHDELVARDGHYADLYRAWATHQATPEVA
ncbi:MAG: ABC transporter ATP-binding protein/permease [Actinomycetota bacterium]|nr:ABC transporter ATP-binding protein/permease [Actinomycetota bacterium]